MPLIVLILAIGVVGGMFVLQAKAGDSSPSISGGVPFQNDLGLWDISPLEQHGSYSTSYDSYFQIASEETGIPFALIKAHSYRESKFNPNAYRSEPARSGRPPSASYGLMQILWWKSSQRFQKYGWNDDTIGDGSLLYQPDVNTKIGASIMLDNWNNFKNLRDTVNAYNTGTSEVTRQAPNNYVDDVLKVYSDLIGRSV